MTKISWQPDCEAIALGWRLMRSGLLCLLLASLLLGFPIAAWAKEPLAIDDLPVVEVSPNRSTLDANAIASEKVTQFVQAYLKVLALIEQREGELQGAETESESLRVQQEIEAAAFDIIKTAGLTGQEYLQLLGLANIDPEFGERIATQLQEATE
jgi:hypothetical protein